jgi:hypothetical protein
MGWRNLPERHWRCRSLRHMMFDDHGTGEAHDPYVDFVAFMRCADEVVSYGFPRPAILATPFFTTSTTKGKCS